MSGLPEYMDVANGRGWRFASKVALVVLPIFVVQGTAAVWWLGGVEERLGAVEKAVLSNKTELKEHEGIRGHPGALAIEGDVKALRADIANLKETIERLDGRIQRQWDEFNRRNSP